MLHNPKGYQHEYDRSLAPRTLIGRKCRHFVRLSVLRGVFGCHICSIELRLTSGAHNRRISLPTLTRPGAGRRVLAVGNGGLAKRRRDSEYGGSDKPPSNATRGKRRRFAPPFPPSCMCAMPVTASPPPRASPSLFLPLFLGA